jgi:hypothetical protein
MSAPCYMPRGTRTPVPMLRTLGALKSELRTIRTCPPKLNCNAEVTQACCRVKSPELAVRDKLVTDSRYRRINMATYGAVASEPVYDFGTSFHVAAGDTNWK